MHSIIDCDGLIYQAAYNVKDVAAAYNKLVEKITYLTTYHFDQDGKSTLFIGGKGNWRKDVFAGYKAQRVYTPDANSILRFGLMNFLEESKLVIRANGSEADDLVRRKAEAMRSRGQPYIVISADKDLDMIVGPHLKFNQKWKIESYDITEDQSNYNYFYQLLIGDMGDNIRSPKLLGPARAKFLLENNPKENWKKVVEQEYKDRCGSEWEHALYFTGSLVHIQRYQNDMFTWNGEGNWFEKGFSGIPTCYPYTDKQLGKA